MARLSFTPFNLALSLFIGIVILTILSVFGHAVQYFYGEDVFVEYVRLFNLSGEGNIPAWFSALGLMVCAGLLAFIAAEKASRRDRRFINNWRLLAVIFLYISIDEAAQIHELLIDPIRLALGVGGFLYFAWVIPFSILLIIFLIAYIPFLRHLPKEIRFLFIFAGAVYVGGALGIELVSGYVFDYYPEATLVRGGLATLEEFMEMTGITLFIYSLLTYLRKTAPVFQIQLVHAQGKEAFVTRQEAIRQMVKDKSLAKD